MITTKDLIDIPEDKRKRAIECLDNLLTFKDDQGNLTPIITGYNFYTELPKSDAIITLSHIHETENYKQDMISSLEKLGYNSKEISKYIRKKAGAFLWELNFNIRDKKGNLLPCLKIKDIKNKSYVDLKKFSKPLVNYSEFKNFEVFIAENQGWELNLPFNNKKELITLVDLFLKKSGEFIYDENRKIIKETLSEKQERAPWADAYETPVLILGENALRFAEELPHFIECTKIILKENSNELSFIIHKNLKKLRDFGQYKELLNLGFKEEYCLGNKPFVAEYIDKER